MPNRPVEIPKGNGKFRTLQIPCIRDRVVQGAARLRKKDLKPPVLLGEAVRMVAKIGGYLGCNNDPAPGHELIWQGYTALQFMAFGFALKEE